MIASLIAFHRALLDPTSRKDALDQLEKLAAKNSALTQMLVASLLGGLGDERCIAIRRRLLESPDAKVVAWGAFASTTKRPDDSPASLGDKMRRLELASGGAKVPGFNLKDYEFFWEESLSDICERFLGCLPYAPAFETRYKSRRGSLGIGIADSQIAWY